MPLKSLLLLCSLLLSALNCASEEISIHLKWYHKFQFAGYYAAIEQGYFADEGLNVRLIEGGPHNNHLHQLINGNSQYATLGSESITSLALGSPVVIVASIFQHAPEVIITLKSSGIDQLSKLKDKTLMLADKSLAGQIDAMLLKNNIPEHHYKKLSYDGDITKLINKKVDAIYGYVSNEPFQIQLLGEDVNIFSPQEYGIDFYGDSLATTQQELNKHPERVAKIRRAVIRGWHYAIEHPEEIIQYTQTLKTVNPIPFTIEHQRYEAQKTIELIDAQYIPLGFTSPDRWTIMFDTFNEVTNGQAAFDRSAIYDEFHNDTGWVKIFIWASLIPIALLVVLYIWNRTLAQRLQQALYEFEQVAFKDPLTGMKNRSSLIVYFERCRKEGAKHLYLTIIDISGLQRINKTLGFQKADSIIQEVASQIIALSSNNSRYYSLYGGKFAIVSYAKNQQQYEIIYNHLIHKISEADESINLNAGGAELDFSVNNSDLTTRAELALQFAKSNKLDDVVVFNQKIIEKIDQQEKLLSDVKIGIQQQQFIAYMQPKVHCQNHKVIGFEALIRWQHPEQGLLLPGKFLNEVENSFEHMMALEDYILEHVLAQANTLIERYHHQHDFRISINLSSRQFNRPALVNTVLKICQKYQVSPDYIEFEITESSMLENLDAGITTSKSLQKAGFSVALDDFGTGYSSLSYIQNLSVNVVKLDYSFIKKIPKDIRSGYVIEHIISLAHQLGLKVVAEGVEELEQLTYLSNLNVDTIQGFYFYKPMPIADAIALTL